MNLRYALINLLKFKFIFNFLFIKRLQFDIINIHLKICSSLKNIKMFVAYSFVSNSYVFLLNLMFLKAANAPKKGKKGGRKDVTHASGTASQAISKPVPHQPENIWGLATMERFLRILHE